MLEVRDLTKRFKGKTVVSGVSFTLERGQVLGLLGPNGAGKTTTFDMIVGLVRASDGRIILEGEDLAGRSMNARAALGLGYLPQEASIFRNLDVRANVMAALELRPDLDRRARKAELDRLLEDLQVAHLAQQKGRTLSGGERRRVEIARALAAAPSFMLLDEPFAGVDPISVGDIRAIVAHLKDRGIGVLITDHNVRETLQICDRALILAEGRIVCQGAPEAILADETVRRVYLGADFKL
ncbi:MAG: LPS export ABC transporter ATP-binding protein [Planctomycetes bacterium]|nr:LPS export ABC transporter ATP-binding protein [Planctomycetota bacterium]